MLITRTPLRISIGGGGTDLPSYYEQFGGFLVSAAIDRYIYVSINRTFTDDYFLKYSALERVREPGEIEHPIIRTALQLHPIGPSLEIVSLADIPAGTGLGSSGTFTVGLLRALVEPLLPEHAHERAFPARDDQLGIRAAVGAQVQEHPAGRARRNDDGDLPKAPLKAAEKWKALAKPPASDTAWIDMVLVRSIPAQRSSRVSRSRSAGPSAKCAMNSR